MSLLWPAATDVNASATTRQASCRDVGHSSAARVYEEGLWNGPRFYLRREPEGNRKETRAECDGVEVFLGRVRGLECRNQRGSYLLHFDASGRGVGAGPGIVLGEASCDAGVGLTSRAL